MGSWVRVHTLPSLTADREGVVLDYMNRSHWYVDLGDGTHILHINQFVVIPDRAEEVLGKEYFE